MRITGVIAEYNPFHHGHAWQLLEARRLTGADYVIVVMSSCFTQRGEAAVLPPAVRAQMALHCGADAVFALPALHAVRDAEHFALAGVTLLNGLCCDAISFGAESGDLTLMQRTARMLEGQDAVFGAALQRRLKAGASHPAALSEALAELLPDSHELLSSPNNTLGVCYLRAMQRIGSRMEAFPVQRIGDYHATTLAPAAPSATALRSAILRGDWQQVQSAMPAPVWEVLRRAVQDGLLHRPDALDQALLYRLRTMPVASYRALPDVSEGIEYRLREAAMQSSCREDLLMTAKTRRYPHSRLSRLAAHALLQINHGDAHAADPPEAAWLLGFRMSARPLLSHIKAHGTLPLISKAADYQSEAPWFAAEERAYDLWALGAGLPAGLARTQGVVRV